MIDFIRLLVAGLSLGSVYALIALGFVMVYKATGILNFAQGGLLMLGAYLAQYFINGVGLTFWFALPVAMLVTGLVAMLLQRLVFDRLLSHPAFTVIMATWAVLIVLEQVPPTLFGYDFLTMNDPFGLNIVDLGAVPVFTIDLWTMAFAGIAVGSLAVFFFGTRIGLAMRATASDPEAAIAQGIDPRLIHATAWFIAGALACIAGVMLGGGSRLVSPELSQIALRAIPAVILGGLASPIGAVVGGLLIGIAEVLTATWAPSMVPWMGKNLHLVMPYFLLVGFLMLRPQGLFGKAASGRV
ncbi:branched-chain amino acid ABC transporter permease [uncultured Sneathiella sp.]|uniref:branched-chain amino acid ABC transporter permease n=1 Tax=uncultured Sneathiella sp. TaxID=879315 RepID=UPI0025949B6C|nr:branched-chain amino acid ABC transporter permease [uncultured Sneathiella sp.]